MSENIQPTSEENKIVESLKKDNLSKNPSGVNVEQPTINLEQNRFECRSCGYIYDPSEGNKKLNIPKNTPFSELDGNTFVCPVCRAGKKFIHLFILVQRVQRKEHSSSKSQSSKN